MTLQPEDFWSFYEWLFRPGAFLESALLQGIVLLALLAILGLVVGYLVAAARSGPGEGFYSVARVIRDFLARDLPGTSARRVYALSRLAFKEAIRRKVLFVVGLFLVGLLLAGWYLDPRSDDPAKLYISFVLTATNYLVLLLALFISTFSLPADIKNRTIHTVVTKPVRPTEIIFGRILGFTAVGTAVLVPMGLASYFFVRRGLDHRHDVAEVRELPGGGFEGQSSFDRNHRHVFTLPEEGPGLTDVQRAHHHVVRRDGESFTIGPPTGMLRARVPIYGSVQFLDRSGRPTDKGINVGYEDIGGGHGAGGVARLLGRTSEPLRHQHGYIEGASLSAAVYSFSNVRPDRFATEDDALPLEMTLRAYRTYKGDIVTGVNGTITLRNPDEPIESNPFQFEVQEYRVDQQFLPRELAGTEGTESRQLDLYDDLVTPDGRLEVVIRCIDRGQYLGMTQGDVYLKAAENPFWWNLTKGFASIWLQMVLIIALGVMFSTFLSGSVAMVATLVCLIVGFSAESVYALSVGETPGGGPLESSIRLFRQDSMTTELDVDSTTHAVVRGVDTVIVKALDAVATALPNLPKMNAADFVANGFDVFGSLLARHGATTLIYVLATAAIGYFFLKTREVAG